MGHAILWLEYASKLFKSLMLLLALYQPQHGLGTRFAPPNMDATNTGSENQHMACLVRDRPNRKAIRLLWKGAIVAHRTLACMTEIELCVDRTGLCERAVVADWGPMHADIDIYHQLAKRLHHNGMETVTWRVIGSLSARKARTMKVPTTDEGVALYGRLKEAVGTAAKGVVKKAQRIMLEFECGYGSESIMIARAKKLFNIKDPDTDE